ncbi:MAG: hypothetical protein AB8B71_10315 [Paracoccaceae bacterium]
MVALKKYDRIEAAGLWRDPEDGQRRDVIVVLGDATLTIKAMNDTPLAHWSIPAIVRANPGKTPARFHPDGDTTEELELPENEAEMTNAIETLLRAVDRARPTPGRLRGLGVVLSFAIVLYGLVFWLPSALVTHTLTVVPDVARKDIGAELLGRITRVAGPVCGTTSNSSALARLGTRLEVSDIAVIRSGTASGLYLPGGLILIPRQHVEDHDEPDIAAGFILAQHLRSTLADPLQSLLDHAGLRSTFRLLTSGQLDTAALDSYSEYLMRVPQDPIPAPLLLNRFAEAKLRSAPYAYALDITGETVLPLIEADPMRNQIVTPLISDADWLRLQAICAG